MMIYFYLVQCNIRDFETQRGFPPPPELLINLNLEDLEIPKKFLPFVKNFSVAPQIFDSRFFKNQARNTTHRLQIICLSEKSSAIQNF